MMLSAEVQCLCGNWERILRPEKNPCRVEFMCGACHKVMRVSFLDVVESPAEQPPPTDTPTP
jgi:hypothetical protein